MNSQSVSNKINVLKCWQKTIERFVFINCLLLMQSCSLLMPGSYPEAEYYEFDMSKDELINRIVDFKNNIQNYKLMEVENGERIEYPDKYIENFFRFYFYFPDTHQTIHCIINTNATKPVRIGLTSLCNGPNFSKCKIINSEEISEEENKEIKEKFEVEILGKLGEWKRLK